MIQTSDVPGIPVPEIPESGSGWLKALQGLSFDDAISNMANGLVSFSFKLLIAILVFYLGKYIIRKIYKAHPLFQGFIKAALDNVERKEQIR